MDGLTPWTDGAASSNRIASLVEPGAIADSLPQNAAPGQVNDGQILGGGMFEAAATTFGTLANGLPVLHSKVGAPTAVYLDFEGWSGNGFGGNQTFAPYDTDGNTATFGAGEQATIAEHWRRVADYMAAFDTDVTTIKPSVPFSWNIISPTVSGGYSYLQFNSSVPSGFNNSGDVLGRTSGILHEMGHNFGLQHQSAYDLIGVKTAEYRGKFDNLHGVTMGVDFDGTVPKWIIGHPTGDPSGLQDDVNIIAGKIKPHQPPGGDGMRADDVGGTLATATTLPVAGDRQARFAIIERLTDVDAFRFSSAGGRYAIDAVPDTPSTADLKLEIYDAAGTLLAASDTSGIDQHLTLDLPAGNYFALVKSHGNYDDIGPYEIAVQSGLPLGWTNQDVGGPGLPGFASYSQGTGTYTIGGSGTAIGGTADSFQYAYQQLTGDGSIVARLTSIENTDASSKAGVMIREALTAGSKSAFMLGSFSNGTWLRSRATNNAATTDSPRTAEPFAPVWLKLTRTGTTFRGYTSSDGVNWLLEGTSTISMASKVWIGLAVTATNNSAINVSTFTNVSLTGTVGSPAPTYNSLPAPAGLAVTATTETTESLEWQAVAGATGYRVERSTDGVGFASAGTTAANVTTYTDTGRTSALRHFYRVRAIDATGDSIASETASGVTRAGAVTDLTVSSWTTSQLILNWREATSETGYRIERSLNGTTFVTAGTVSAQTPSFTDSGLTAGTKYYYRVVTLDGAGDAATSAVGSTSTRLATVTGLAITAKASTDFTLQWTDIAGETGYRLERSTNRRDFTALATVGANVTTYHDLTVQPLGTYYYRIVGLSPIAESAVSGIAFAAAPPATPLPQPWSAQELGTVNGSGATGGNAGVFTVVSTGSDIEGGNDSFRYTSQPLVGDGEIVARVVNVENTNAAAEIGIMIREAFTTGSRHAMMLVTPENGSAFRYRSTTGAAAVSVLGSAAASAPLWLKLTRSGNVFRGYSSSDGISYTQVGQFTIAMGTSVYAGLAASAHDIDLLNTSKFDNVAVTNRAPTVASPASATPAPVTGATTLLTVLGADDKGETNLTYTWSATAVPAGAAPPTFATNGNNAAKTVGATFYAPGSYTFEVQIKDSGQLAVTSGVSVNVITTAAAIQVAPAFAALDGGATADFSAVVVDQFSSPLAVQPKLTWSASGGSISAEGHFTAPYANLPVTITAQSASLSGTANVNVSIASRMIVSNALDAGFGSLRAALAAANSTPGVIDRLAFDLPGPVSQAIQLASALPALVGEVAFDVKSGRSVRLGETGFSLPDFSLISKEGLGTLIVSGAPALTAATIQVNQGLLETIGDWGQHLALRVSGTVGFHGSQSLAKLELLPNGRAFLADNAVLVLDQLALAGSSQLDLGAGGLIVHAAPDTRSDVLSLLSNAAHLSLAGAPAWSGAGLASSAAATDARHLEAVGVMLNTLGGGPLITQFMGRTVGASDVLARTTYFGDANLDGIVDGTDYSIADDGYNFGLSGWQHGDFNYDQSVDGTDYALIDNAFNSQPGPLASAALAPVAPIPPSGAAAGRTFRASPSATSLESKMGGPLGLGVAGPLGPVAEANWRDAYWSAWQSNDAVRTLTDDALLDQLARRARRNG